MRTESGRIGDRGGKAKLVSLFDTLRSNGWEPGDIAGWDDDAVNNNYKIIVDSGTSTKNLPLASVAIEFLAAHAPDTVRGNMYLVVSSGWLPDTSRKSYGRIQRLLNRLRENGTISFEWIVDNIRSTIKPSSWSGLADFTDTVRDAYRKNYWDQLPDYIEVIVEKDTLAGKVSQVTREYDVRLHPLRGYSSSSFAWHIAQGWRKIEKPICIYYIGDHDPSGRDLERNICQKLSRYAECDFTWVRLGVNASQFDEFNVLPLAAKKSDKRYRWFVEQYGEECAEAEAIPANDMRAMVRKAIESHIPQDSWKRLKQVEELERSQWHAVMDGFEND